MFKTNWMDNLTLILSESTWLLIPKKPTLLFEKSTGRRPGWCGQPLRVVGLGRDGTLHGTYESRSCLFLLGRPVSRKACKTKQHYWLQQSRKYSTTCIIALLHNSFCCCFTLLHFIAQWHEIYCRVLFHKRFSCKAA